MNENDASASRKPLPPAFLLVAIALMIALHILVPLIQLFRFPWDLFGVGAIVVGLALNIWTDQLFKQANTTVKPFETSQSLVLTEPFRFTRNPMYLGMALVLVGIAVGLGSATPWLVVPLFIWQIHQRFILAEERRLEAAFGQQYLAYKARVRRWF